MLMSSRQPLIRSLVWATDIDVLDPGHELTRREDHWVVRSPSNPAFWWGNLLLFDDPPRPGDGERWELLFADAFAADPQVSHRTFAWDTTDGSLGAAAQELLAHGFELERQTGLVASAATLRSHPRESRGVSVRALAAHPGGDERLWSAVLELQRADSPDGVDADAHLEFLRRRQAGVRALLAAGRGGWFVALDGERVVGTLGLLVHGGRARYQAVQTAVHARGRGVASRLVVEAARMIAQAHEVEHFVIAADPDHHALGIYESLGFSALERVCGAVRAPGAA